MFADTAAIVVRILPAGAALEALAFPAGLIGQALQAVEAIHTVHRKHRIGKKQRQELRERNRDRKKWKKISSQAEEGKKNKMKKQTTPHSISERTKNVAFCLAAGYSPLDFVGRRCLCCSGKTIIPLFKRETLSENLRA